MECVGVYWDLFWLNQGLARVVGWEETASRLSFLTVLYCTRCIRMYKDLHGSEQ